MAAAHVTATAAVVAGRQNDIMASEGWEVERRGKRGRRTRIVSRAADGVTITTTTATVAAAAATGPDTTAAMTTNATVRTTAHETRSATAIAIAIAAITTAMWRRGTKRRPSR